MEAPGGVVEFVEALRRVEREAKGLHATAVETVELLDGAGRVLAAEVRADRDQPAFDRATRDGFAVRAAELTAGELPVIGQVRAGETWSAVLPPRVAVQIMTGAPVPAGADAVVMVEHVEQAAGEIRLSHGRTLAIGDNIVRCGAEARVGTAVLQPGIILGAAEIALAAFCGCRQLTVYAEPSVAIVATGDELVEVGEEPGPEQIRNSNSYGIAVLVARAKGQPRRLSIARDVRDELRQRISEGRQADLLVFSGGVSMGEYDLVEEVLAEYAAKFFFTGVQMQPGKPVVFGRLPALENQPARYFFGLPGNPISTQVTFQCFVEPFLRTLAGAAWPGPRWALARLAEAAEAKGTMTRLLPGHMAGTEVRLVGWQGSGDLAANARANVYVELLPGRAYAEGDMLRVLLQ